MLAIGHVENLEVLGVQRGVGTEGEFAETTFLRLALSHLPMQNWLKITSSRSSVAVLPTISPTTFTATRRSAAAPVRSMALCGPGSSWNQRVQNRLDPGVAFDVVNNEITVELPVRPAPAELLGRPDKKRQIPCA